MIDQDKMRALAKRLSEVSAVYSKGQVADIHEAADAIDLLLAEVEAAAADKRDEPTLEMIRAGLNVMWPGLYKDGLFTEYDGPNLRLS